MTTEIRYRRRLSERNYLALHVGYAGMGWAVWPWTQKDSRQSVSAESSAVGSRETYCQ
jgi:hypothetical protein